MRRVPDGFVRIGSVDVDSGTLMIGDPCYLDGGFDYDKWADLSVGNGNGVIPGPNDWDKPGEATVAMYTAYGDGTYPVYGLFDNGQITAMLVDTDPEYDFEDD